MSSNSLLIFDYVKNTIERQKSLLIKMFKIAYVQKKSIQVLCSHLIWSPLSLLLVITRVKISKINFFIEEG